MSKVSQIKKYEEIKEKLEKELKLARKNNFKESNIRNLKLLLSTCNFLVPFLITAGITTGVFSLFGGGLPFHKDDIKKYKAYNMDFISNGYVTMHDEYRTNHWYDNSIGTSKLVIFTPWEQEGSKFVRYRKEYKGEVTTLDLFDAVMNEDYEQIQKLIKEEPKEEKQVTNKLDANMPNDYYIEASLHFLDEEDMLRYSESDLKNILISIIETVLTLSIGAFNAHTRRFDFFYEVSETNRVYKFKIKPTKGLKEDLKDVDEKLLLLTKSKGI